MGFEVGQSGGVAAVYLPHVGQRREHGAHRSDLPGVIVGLDHGADRS
jgi:hypothetical protein